MSIDLIARATANSTQRDADAACAGDGEGTLAQLCDTMAASTMGNTVDVDRLWAYAGDQQILSARAAALAKAKGNAQEAERLLRERAVDGHGVDWYARRAAFEDPLEAGPRLGVLGGRH